MEIKNFIRSIPDYPKKGILFRDITTLIKNEKAFAESINQITLKKDKYYICEDISNYSGSPGVDKNPKEFYKKNCETSPSLIGSSICLKNNHCKLDKLFLEEYLDKECKKISKTKHKQYFIKNSKKNSKNIEVTYECRKKRGISNNTTFW